MKRYRAAVLGCGVAGSLVDTRGPSPLPQSHAGMYAANSRFELVAGCDPDEARLQEFEATWKPNGVYRDPAALFSSERLDVVSICAPTGAHPTLLEAAIEAGIPVVVLEKPVASRVVEAELISARLVSAQTRVVVAYQRRWSSGFIRLAEHLKSGGLGVLRRIQVNYPMGIIHGGSHAVDLLQWLFGPIHRVRALTPLSGDVIDEPVDCVFSWDSGLEAWCQGFARQPWNIFEMDLLGDSGRVRISLGGRRMEFLSASQDPNYSRLTSFLSAPAPFANDWESTYLNLAEHVLELLDEPTSRPHCSFQDGLLALRVAEAALVSAREGCREVRL